MDQFYSYFNIALGIIMILIGLKVYVPKFKSEEKKNQFYKLQYFYLLGGIAMALWGFFKVLLA
ncbi:MAG: hypothetical protein CMB80_05015 [Flammeovirgaceae bacterium]|nr:hypothetical protein [Flammeovirgaceae bacterium]MBE63359.1 hypothetical protein [Flammeovirgaceae bacterium]|tara:strand:+ start:588 stop:776 length:189 start_codon:yes stop_codon:yes gene_type:complete